MNKPAIKHGIFWTVLLAAWLLAASRLAGGGLAYYEVGIQSGAEITPTASVCSQIADCRTLMVSYTNVETTITRVVQEVGPAVVTVVGKVELQGREFRGSTVISEVSGSGVFISLDGYILTSNHVVEDAHDLHVVLADGTRQEAVLVGSDMYADLAVLKTEGSVPTAAVLGSSSALDPGETVIAIGSPLGEFTNSVTVGVVSATGRSIDTGSGYRIEDLIQTDAAINEGNSGGPLVNLAGEVVGINTLVVRSSGSGTAVEGLGFAVASSSIAPVAEQIIQTGSFTRPGLGIEWQAVTPYIAARYRLGADYGVYITSIAVGSPAQKAGLKVGDSITRVGEIELDASRSFLNVLYQHQPGEVVSIGYVRGGQEAEVLVLLGES